jgi:hypothetical protein
MGGGYLGGCVLVSDPLVTPFAAADLARAKLKQRDDAIRANGIKEGRRLARDEIIADLGAQSLEELGLLNALRHEHDQALAAMRAGAEREERKHGAGKWWQGAVVGGAIVGSAVAAGAALYARAVIDSAFDAAAQMRTQSDITDAIVRERRATP